jgi:hypothetical protein
MFVVQLFFSMKIFRSVLLLCLCGLAISGFSQKKNYKIACVGFYNLENFYDTIDDPKTNDADFLPTGSYNYNSAIYRDKVSKLSDVISLIGTDETPDGLALLGTAEVENEKVLQDLAAQPKIKSRNYKIVHYDSPDERGVDVALLYNPKYFRVNHSEPLFVKLLNGDGSLHYTRDVLWVSGELDGEMVHVFVNHWPSRRGGEEASAPGRAAAANVSKHVIDSLMKINPDTKILVMGDLNDDPVSPSVAEVLNAKGKKEEVKQGGLYNPWVDFYKKGIGTLAYNDSWNLFDQIMLSSGFLSKTQSGLFFHQAHIFNREFMVTKSGKYKGYPMRTFDGNSYNGGYSDHFPTYCVFLKEVK